MGARFQVLYHLVKEVENVGECMCSLSIAFGSSMQGMAVRSTLLTAAAATNLQLVICELSK